MVAADLFGNLHGVDGRKVWRTQFPAVPISRAEKKAEKKKRNFQTTQRCINVIFNSLQARAGVSGRKSLHFRREGQEHQPESPWERLRERERN